MSVKKRGSTYHYDITIKNKRYRGPLPTARTKRDAETQEDRIRISIIDGTFKQPSALTLREFVEEIYWPWCKTNHRSVDTDKYFLKVIKNFFGETALSQVSPLAVERFKRERMAARVHGHRERRPSTVNKELACLSRLFSLAIETGHAKDNPCRRVRMLRVDNQRTRYLSEEEETRLLRGCTARFQRLRAVVVIAINAGLRLGEICKLKTSDIDAMRGELHVRDTKSGKPRAVPLNATLSGLFDELIAATGPTPDSRLFGFDSKAITFSFRRLTEKLSLSNLHFHDLRHTFATRLADRGADPFTIADLLGHADLRMTRRYTHALDQNKRRAVISLDKASPDYGSSGHKSVTGEVIRLRKQG